MSLSATGNRGGASLGLAVAKASTEQQRGTLTVRSRAGCGTTVRLTYPTVRGVMQAGAGEMIPAAAA